MKCPACRNEVGQPLPYFGTGFTPKDQAQQCVLCGSIFPLFFWQQMTEKGLTFWENYDIINIENEEEDA